MNKPLAVHEDAHREPQRNRLSLKGRNTSLITNPEENNTPEDSSKSTSYDDSSLIKKLHTQLAFQDNDKREISQPTLNQENKTPLNPEEEYQQASKKIQENNKQINRILDNNFEENNNQSK